jgi:hypothetical protein
MESITKDAFLAAVADTKFHNKWMTLETWGELICPRYNLVNSNAFTGIDLKSQEAAFILPPRWKWIIVIYL